MPVSEEIEKTPTGNTSVSEPESGTYGEKAELNNLKKQLPSSGQHPQQSTMPTSPAPNGSAPATMGRPASGPSKLPNAMMAPQEGSVNPNVPLTQAQQMPPRPPAADQQRLAILDALSTHPEVSEETREWATLVRDYLIAGRTI